ncbi:MAG: aminotransferase class V-fold PLP-dependent enzyme [Lachnospiraceae bacterium]
MERFESYLFSGTEEWRSTRDCTFRQSDEDHTSAQRANNTAIRELYSHRAYRRHIISTPLEHSSVSGTLTALQEKDSEIDLLDIMRDGMVDCEQLEDLMTKHTVLISVCAIDSELGTIQPIDKIIEIKKKYPDCRLHVDERRQLDESIFF